MKQLFLVLLLVAGGRLCAQLSGSKWVLISIDNLETGVSKDIGASVRATLHFETDSTYSGLFCNNYNGRVRYKENAIRMGTPNHTKRICMGINKYENEMFDLIPQANKFRIDGDALYIFTANKMRLSYKKDKQK